MNQTADTFLGFNTKFNYSAEKWASTQGNSIQVPAISDDVKENISGFENSAYTIQSEYMKNLEN